MIMLIRRLPWECTATYIGISERTKANLQYIEKAYAWKEPNVYNATQLINSLLGMVVFLKEAELVPDIRVDKFAGGICFETIINNGNSHVKLRDFLRSFRNSISHGNIEDFGHESEIYGFIFRDRVKRNKPFHWGIKISLDEIRKLAFGLVDYVIQNSPKEAAA